MYGIFIVLKKSFSDFFNSYLLITRYNYINETIKGKLTYYRRFEEINYLKIFVQDSDFLYYF